MSDYSTDYKNKLHKVVPAASVVDTNNKLSEPAPEFSITSEHSENVPNHTVSGNTLGSKALMETASKIDSLLENSQTEKLELTEVQKSNYRSIAEFAREYATEGRAFLSAESKDFPEHIDLTEKHATYDIPNDILYLKVGPENSTDFNTIIHELSHAMGKNNLEMQIIKEYNSQYGEKETFEDDNHKLAKLDQLLALTKSEWDAEITGNIAEQMDKNAKSPDEASKFKFYKEKWENKEFQEKSSSDAKKEWSNMIVVMMSGIDEQNHDFDSIKYKDAALAYLMDEIKEFPNSKQFYN